MPCIFWIEIKGLSCVCSILTDCPFEPSVLINWPTTWSWNRKKEASTLRSEDSRKQIYNYPKSWALFPSMCIQRINQLITHMNSWLVHTSHNLISAQWLIMMHAHSFVCLYCIYMLLHVTPCVASFLGSPVCRAQQGRRSCGVIWHSLSSYQWAACLLVERGMCYWQICYLEKDILSLHTVNTNTCPQDFSML